MSKNLSFNQNGIIFYAKRNSARTVAFGMPTNVGPTYGMYVGVTLYQRYMSNMSYVGALLRQHAGPTMTQRANLHCDNAVCQCWANEVANQNTLLAQCYHAIDLGMRSDFFKLSLHNTHDQPKASCHYQIY